MESESDSERDNSKEKEPMIIEKNQSSFFNKLQQLNGKIHVFKDQFYKKKPRNQLSYDRILKEKKLNFTTFKHIYGHSEVEGVRTVKIGNDTLHVDNQNYTFQVAPPPENEARKRLLGQTASSSQKIQGANDHAVTNQLAAYQKRKTTSSFQLPQVVQKESTANVLEIGSQTL